MSEREQRCGDCMKVIRPDEDHTCKRQRAANRRPQVEPESLDRTERIEQTQQFFETDWETAVLIDDCMGE